MADSFTCNQKPCHKWRLKQLKEKKEKQRWSSKFSLQYCSWWLGDCRKTKQQKEFLSSSTPGTGKAQDKELKTELRGLCAFYYLLSQEGKGHEIHAPTNSSILARKIPWTEEPGGLQSMGSQKVRHAWAHIYNRFLGPKALCWLVSIIRGKATSKWSSVGSFKTS